MTRTSFQNGKAFEYMVCKALLNSGHLTAGPKVEEKQDRDQKLIAHLGDSARQYMALSAQFVSDYVRGEGFVRGVVDRPEDSKGEGGDPADIVITNQSSALRISLKNANDSIKHQRPSALARHLGFSKSNDGTQIWAESYQLTLAEFFKQHEDEKSIFKTSELETRQLYDLVNAAAVRFINLNASSRAAAATSFYDFLVGPANVVTATASPKAIAISNWTLDRKVTQVSAILNGDGIELEFSNGHRFHLRLHTADSEISRNSPSLKWDTKSLSPMTIIARKTF